MAVAYPAFLPVPLRAAYGFETADVVSRTPVEGGPVRQRQIAPPGPETLALQWVMSDVQQAYFKAFYQFGLSSGSALCDMPIRTNGNSVETQTVNFASAPRYQLLSPTTWQVSATVQTRTPKLMDADLYAALTESGSMTDTSAFEASADDLHTLVNITIPESML